MLARTHGQPASPTTLGKEFANVAARLQRARSSAGARWRSSASGTARSATSTRTSPRCPTLDWPRDQPRVRRVAAASSATPTPRRSSRTTGSPSTAMRCAAINVDRSSTCAATSGATSRSATCASAPVAGEVGSSTMPHKVNPIDFENAEGNLGVANALLRHFADKLPRVALAARPHRLHRAAQRRRRARPHADRLAARSSAASRKIEARPGALARRPRRRLGSARRSGADRAARRRRAERLRAAQGLHARPAPSTRATLGAFIDTLPLPPSEKARLRALTPADYIGLAAQLARGSDARLSGRRPRPNALSNPRRRPKCELAPRFGLRALRLTGRNRDPLRTDLCELSSLRSAAACHCAVPASRDARS